MSAAGTNQRELSRWMKNQPKRTAGSPCHELNFWWPRGGFYGFRVPQLSCSGFMSVTVVYALPLIIETFPLYILDVVGEGGMLGFAVVLKKYIRKVHTIHWPLNASYKSSSCPDGHQQVVRMWRDFKKKKKRSMGTPWASIQSLKSCALLTPRTNIGCSIFWSPAIVWSYREELL